MNHGSLTTLLAALTLSALAFGCSSSPSPGSGDNDAGGVGNTTGDASAEESFTDLYTNVLGPKCSTHHAPGAGNDSFLDLSSKSAAYTSLVNVKASGPACGPQDGGTAQYTRVIPGNPTTSLLYEKVADSTPPCGAQMPFEGTPLSTDEVTKIAAWILGGAPNN
jgi:hypothetical protein